MSVQTSEEKKSQLENDLSEKSGCSISICNNDYPVSEKATSESIREDYLVLKAKMTGLGRFLKKYQIYDVIILVRHIV